MSKTCPKCDGRMETGFVLDSNYGSGSAMVSHWMAGKPVKSIWTGLKTKGRKKIEIRTERCTRCGYLENYAA
ncbi:hypothetical protein VCJ71_03280 [Alteriqipengyuania sp. WL0013]|nr:MULTISPECIES: hypothetical protein [Alteriqipengyuania]MEB3415084.1 hypothetical protein [Alteriqipengyuania sp. WL0013]WJY18397.1 hypothetical protein QQW98_12370 [Alteriqipengyuania flavescens]WJY24338.1 hypothetical protein QQS45_12375 [Alteriqipengyuania flavescens]